MTDTLMMPDVPTATDEFSLSADDTVKARYQHLNLRRRVRIGANVRVVFEDRHTLWFRMRELSGIARAAINQVGPQLHWYQRLMPARGRLTAAVTVTSRGQRGEPDPLRTAITDGRLVLRSDAGHEVIGQYLPHVQSDPLLGLMRWCEFRFPAVAVEALHDGSVGWELSIEVGGETLDTAAVPEAVLTSLSADLG